MRSRPKPRNGKRVGNEVWFDVKLSPPLGLALDTSLGLKGVTYGVTLCLVKPKTSWTQWTQNTHFLLKSYFYLHSLGHLGRSSGIASRSFDGEAVGVSEVVEGGSAFEYNKGCLNEEFVGSDWLWVAMRDGLQ